MMDLQEFYNTNRDFRMYVDKYCDKHDKETEEAFNDVMIHMVADFYKSKEEGK